MARKNRFAESSSGIAELLDNGTTPFAEHVIEQNKEAINNSINKRSPYDFKEYEDEKIRLDLHNGEEKERLKESIQQNGIMIPIICNENMMILSGHNRVAIAKELGIEVPYIIKEGLTKEQMDLIVIDTNLLNRQIAEYKISQLAYILKVKMDTEKHQGVTSSTGLTKQFTGDKIGDEYGLSRFQISRYIRLNNLIPIALDMLDAKKISIKLGYQMSFLSEEIQSIIMNYSNIYNVNEKLIKSLRQELEGIDNPSEEVVKAKLFELCNTTKQVHKIDYRNIKKYIPDDIKPAEIELYVIKALKAYQG